MDTENSSSRIVKSESSFFEEEELVGKLIEKLCVPLAQDASEELVVQRRVVLNSFTECMEKYQEQSLLLDAYLEQMISPLMASVQSIIREREENLAKLQNQSDQDAFPFQVFRHPHLHILFEAMYVLCRVRGYKTVIKFLPHEVADLEPTLRMLQSQDATDHETWHIRYMLLLWMSILSMIPFDLTSVDSSFCDSTSMSLIDTVFSLCKQYLGDSGPTREAAATCVARLLTRPDLSAEPLAKFLEWATQMLEMATGTREATNAIPSDDTRATDSIQSVFLVTGIYNALVEIFKRGHREKLLPHISAIFTRVLSLSSRKGFISSLERKLTMKLVQRIGLNFLAPRILSWRYQRGHRSLLENFNKSTSGTINSASDTKVGDQEEFQDAEEDDIDIPEEVEDVIEQLLCGLRDKDTIVRWSAAKGVGRITGRLPKEMGDDVVEFVLQLFDAAEGDSAWHGGCLALAELARRGLLLPARLGSVVPLVVKALIYDVRRGHNSVGAHVRDAACYVCWAFARAYAPQVMAPYVTDLARQMLVTALFDREVNCRRAAAAAFQENVGRQGHENFPNGIDILTAADYFTLGIRSVAYTQVAPQVASFSIYRNALVEHLVEVKLVHWDKAIRELTAEALGCLTKLDPELFANDIVVRLLTRALSPDILVRHGAIKALGEIFKALAKVPMEPSDQILCDARNLVMKIEKARLYRGRGGESIRVGTCEFIASICEAGHPLSERAQLRLLDSIDESLKNAVPAVQAAAVGALRAITHDSIQGNASDVSNRRPFWKRQCTPVSDALVERTVQKYCTGLEDENAAVRRGHAMALGALPASYLGQSASVLEKVVQALTKATRFEPAMAAELRDAESRMRAVAALGELVRTLGVECNHSRLVNEKCVGLTETQLQLILNTLIDSMDDYEIDDRGDVGSMVRCQAMRSLVLVTKVVRTYQGRLSLLSRMVDSMAISSDQNNAALGFIKDDGIAYPIVESKQHGACFLVRQATDKSTVWLLPMNPRDETTVVLAPISSVRYRDPVVAWIGDLDSVGNEECVEAMEPSDDVVPSASDREQFLVADADAKAMASIQSQEPVAGSELGKYESPKDVLNETGLGTRIVCGMLKQLGEKLDIVRDTAGQSLGDLLGNSKENIDDSALAVPLVIEHRPRIASMLAKEINYKVGSEVFPNLVELLSCERITFAILGGVSLSVGSITESVSKEASKALVAWCKTQVELEEWGHLNRIAGCLEKLLNDNACDDRVIVPVLKTLDVLLEAQVFNYIPIKSGWALRIHGLVSKQLKGTSNVNKILATIKVFLGLATSFGRPVRTAAFSSLLLLLGYRYPKVRKATAEQFYITAISMSSVEVCGPPGSEAVEAKWDSQPPPKPQDPELKHVMEMVNAKIEHEKAKLSVDKEQQVEPEVFPYQVSTSDIPEDFNADDAFDTLLEILLTSVWDAPTAECRKQREPLYAVLHVKPPAVKVGKVDKENLNTKATEQEDSYASLIHDLKMGY